MKNGLGFPMAYFQLDAWWYPLSASDVFCIQEFTANKTMFPHGLQALSKDIDAPFVLYGHMFCNTSVYRSKYEMISPKLPYYWRNYGDRTDCNRRKCPIRVAQPTGAQSKQFYLDVMGNAKATQGMVSYEVDWMGEQFAEFAEYTSEPGQHRMWLKGMADAALSLGISVQYCMTLPSQMLQSLEFPAVTSMRSSDDGGRPYTTNGPTNMLLWALDIRPFKDNALTTIKNEVVGSVVAMSPVGIGDRMGSSDFAAIKRSCRSDGVILHPSRPGFPLNARYHDNQTAPKTPAAETWTTHSTIGDLTCYTALAGEWGAADTFPIAAADLHPAAAQAGALMWWPWNAAGSAIPSAACGAGNSTAGCLTAMPGSGYVAGGGGGRGAFRLYHACPQVNGWTLLGEREKYIPVSPNRFTRVSMQSNGITAEVVGAAGEMVELTYAKPTGVLAAQSRTISSNGKATFILN